jgi:arginase
MAGSKIAVFGVPSAAGASRPGTERAPFALREAGLLETLRGLGSPVVNLSDLSLFPYRDDASRARNAPVVACAASAAADEMGRALAEGFAGQPVGLIYLDANADLNTPETSPSGLMSGMALALALGRGPEEVVSAGGAPPAVRPEHVSLIGFRELDPGEQHPLGDLGLALPASAARRLGMRTAAALALDAVANDDGPIVVHLDVDVVDPLEMPAKGILTYGPALSLAEVSDLVTAFLASPRVVAIEVMEYDPSGDPEGVHARKIVDLLARGLARRLRR